MPMGFRLWGRCATPLVRVYPTRSYPTLRKGKFHIVAYHLFVRLTMGSSAIALVLHPPGRALSYTFLSTRFPPFIIRHTKLTASCPSVLRRKAFQIYHYDMSTSAHHKIPCQISQTIRPHVKWRLVGSPLALCLSFSSRFCWIAKTSLQRWPESVQPTWMQLE